MSVTEQDNGYRLLVKTVFGFAEPVVTIGIHEKAGSASMTNGKTLVDIANINEFGSADGHVPQRSFVRAPFDAHEAELRKDLVGLMIDVLNGRRTKEQILDIIGQKGVGILQKAIADQIPPPNAPYTIQKKGSSTPLVATGFMRSSITYEVDPGEKKAT